MLRRTPLRTRPPDRDAERAERERNAAIRARADYICEGCSRADRPLEVHHAARRRRVAAELANDPALLVALCFPCHDEITRNPNGPLDDRIMALAVLRLTGAPLGSGENAMDVVRRVERDRGLR